MRALHLGGRSGLKGAADVATCAATRLKGGRPEALRAAAPHCARAGLSSCAWLRQGSWHQRAVGQSRDKGRPRGA
eukprot:28463-Alexandrium_andersonii.AAC.1